jgi:hypothetical protein
VSGCVIDVNLDGVIENATAERQERHRRLAFQDDCQPIPGSPERVPVHQPENPAGCIAYLGTALLELISMVDPMKQVAAHTKTVFEAAADDDDVKSVMSFRSLASGPEDTVNWMSRPGTPE